MNCVPKALATLIKDTNDWWEFHEILLARYGKTDDGWTDLQMVVVAAMYGYYLTPFVEKVDKLGFLEHYYGTDGILVGTTDKGQPHAIAKRNGQWDGTNFPHYDRIFYSCGNRK